MRADVLLDIQRRNSKEEKKNLISLTVHAEAPHLPQLELGYTRPIARNHLKEGRFTAPRKSFSEHSFYDLNTLPTHLGTPSNPVKATNEDGGSHMA